MARDIVGLKINADLLDGLSASDFAQVSGSATFSGSVTATDLVVDDGGTIGSATTPGAVTIASGGNVTLTENLVLASGQGIDFSATSDASGSTSELLDDYEEGTWTPTFDFATTGDLSVSYSTQLGRYVKIGRFVHTNVFLSCTPTFSTSSGDIRISLPFAGATVTNGIRIGAAGNTGGVTLASGRTWLFARQDSSAAYARLIADGSNTSIFALDTTSVVSGASFTAMFSLSYEVA